MGYLQVSPLNISITSSPADSRPRELSHYYWPLPLRLGQTSPLSPLISSYQKKRSTKSKLKISVIKIA